MIYRKRTETDIQIAVVEWLRIQYPRCLFTIAPNDIKMPIGCAVKLKRRGYRKGTPDFIFFEPRSGDHGLLLELKTTKEETGHKGVLSPEQRAFLVEASAKGYKCEVAYGFDEAIQKIGEYLA